MDSFRRRVYIGQLGLDITVDGGIIAKVHWGGYGDVGVTDCARI